jgi:hypothetical protein
MSVASWVVAFVGSVGVTTFFLFLYGIVRNGHVLDVSFKNGTKEFHARLEKPNGDQKQIPEQAVSDSPKMLTVCETNQDGPQRTPEEGPRTSSTAL